MTEGWQPATALERSLLEAMRAGDEDACSTLLGTAELALPVVETDGGEVTWGVLKADGRTFVVVFTSPDAASAAAGGTAVPYLSVHYRALVADWPDHEWGLVVNPGQPLAAWFDPGQVVRMAAPELDDPRRTGGPVVLEQVLTPGRLEVYLRHGETRVMGYAHRLEDAAHLETPADLLRGLGLDGPQSSVSAADAAAYLLRWPGIGPPLYRLPYGGSDEDRMRAVDGWVVEPQPFVGTGFAPSRAAVIREYRVDCVRLPHGAEITRMLPSGEEQLIAVFDADRPGWSLADPGRGRAGADRRGGAG